MTASFPTDGMELTHILLVADLAQARTFYRDGDPDGHLIEISEAKAASG